MANSGSLAPSQLILKQSSNPGLMSQFLHLTQMTTVLKKIQDFSCTLSIKASWNNSLKKLENKLLFWGQKCKNYGIRSNQHHSLSFAYFYSFDCSRSFVLLSIFKKKELNCCDSSDCLHHSAICIFCQPVPKC